jgi:hypothetical protein
MPPVRPSEMLLAEDDPVVRTALLIVPVTGSAMRAAGARLASAEPRDTGERYRKVRTTRGHASRARCAPSSPSVYRYG